MTTIHHIGPPPASARLAMILVHGRGASAADILGVADEFGADDIAYLAPDAPGRTWYPYSFLVPLEQNEPHLTAALETVGAIVTDLGQHGVPPERIGLLGFSQGACLAVEYTVRNLGRSRNIVAFTGGLFGSPGALWPAYPRPLLRTRVLLTGSDADDWVPEERVRDTAQLLTGLGAEVVLRIYAGRPHIIGNPEIEEARKFLRC
jgi:phospholipase/carboxylesterase